MPAKVTLRSDFDALQLRQFAKRSSDTRQTCRLLALAAVYDGMSRGEAAKVGGMDRQTLRDWVHRFNDRVPMGWLIVEVQSASAASAKRSCRRWLRLWRPAPTLRLMVLCVGGGWICSG